MKDNHIFSESYENRKRKVLEALHREDAARRKTPYAVPVRILAAFALLSVLTVSVYAAARAIDFRMEQSGTDVRVHAALSEADTEASEAPKPYRSFRTEEGEISIRLVIPDLPADMEEDKTANGKYHGADTARAMTVNGIDLRRSDLDQLIGGAESTKEMRAGAYPVYIVEMGETAYYSRIAFLVLEKEELVLKFWLSFGITEEEFLTLASTLTVEETADIMLALPIHNEPRGTGSADIPFVYVSEDDPVFASDLIEIGESVRDGNDWYTVTVNSVSVHGTTAVLDPSCILNKDFVARFTDANGKLIPYSRTPIVEDEDGIRRFGESVSATKKLYVVTITMADVTMEEVPEADRDRMLTACVNGFQLHGYTVEDGEIKRISTNNVVNRTPNARADSCEIIYREYLGDGQWKIAYLIDENAAEGDLVLSNDVGEIHVKVQ